MAGTQSERDLLSRLFDRTEQRCAKSGRQSQPYQEVETEYQRLVASGTISDDLQELIGNYLYQTQRIAYVEGLNDGARLQHVLLSGTLNKVVLDVYDDLIG